MEGTSRYIGRLLDKLFNNRHLQIALVLLSGAICYSSTFSVPFYFDDYRELVNDAGITNIENIWEHLLHGGARRFADFTFAINHKIHGLNVAGYHIVNLVIHLVAGVVLYLLCYSVMKALHLYSSREETAESPLCNDSFRYIPFAAAMLFVTHPLQTQAVTYIIQRYTSLAGLFYLCVMLAYVECRKICDQKGSNHGLVRWGLFGAVSILLGLYTKPSFYSFPLMLLMFEATLFRGRLLKKMVVTLCSAGALILAAKAMLLLLSGGSLGDLLFSLNEASKVDFSTPRYVYFLSQLRIMVTYLRLAIIPVNQHLDYDYPEFRTLMDVEVASALVLHLLLLSTAIALFIKSNKLFAGGEDETGLPMRIIAIGIAWFYIGLSVTSTIIPIPDNIAEHRMYLPSAGLFVSFAAMITLIAQKLRTGLVIKRVALIVFCLLLSVATISRNNLWGDELSFWKNEVRLSPQNGRVQSNLAFAYLRHDNYPLAIRSFATAIDLDPTLSRVWLEIGSVLQETGLFEGRFTTGEQYLTPERELDYRHYTRFYSNAFNVMGLIHEHLKEPEEALVWYKKSLALNQGDEVVWFNYGLLAQHLGNADDFSLASKKLKDLDSRFSVALKESNS